MSGKDCILAASLGVIALFKKGWEFFPFEGVSNLVTIVGLCLFFSNLHQVCQNVDVIFSFKCSFHCYGGILLSLSNAISECLVAIWLYNFLVHFLIIFWYSLWISIL